MFPMCIVWTKLPCLSDLFPFLGHTGIGDFSGVIHDFHGQNRVMTNNLQYGEPQKYVKLELRGISQLDFDTAIKEADEQHKEKHDNVCFDNLDSHVATVLNKIKYRGRTDHNLLSVWWMCCTESQYVGKRQFVFTYRLYLMNLAFIIYCLWKYYPLIWRN